MEHTLVTQPDKDTLMEESFEKPDPFADAVEVQPPFLRFDDDEEAALFDFRPVPVDANLPDSPKVSSALESVSSSTSKTIEETESSASQTPIAPVEKDSGQPKENESGTQTSSDSTPAGKTEQPASK